MFCSNQKALFFSEVIEERYSNYIKIYTNGSKLENGDTAASMYIPHLNMATSWKLNPVHSVLGSELFGIFKALEFVLSGLQLRNKNTVIFTDSKSALHLIANTLDPSYKHIVYKIQNYVSILKRVQFQWVRGHIGVNGNEIADKAANLGHENNSSTISTLSLNEVMRVIKTKTFEK